MKRLLVFLACLVLISGISEASWGLAGKRIVVDPGHGGKNPGAVGPTGLKESDANWRVATALKYYLEKQGGAKVLLTRTQYQDVSLAGRVTKANRWGAERFISVHHNAASNPNWNGVETYSPRNGSWASHDMRNKIHNRLVGGLGIRNIGAKTAGFYVLRNTKMPSVLVEPAFVSNRYQEARLKNPAYNWKEAYFIYAGIADHYKVKP